MFSCHLSAPARDISQVEVQQGTLAMFTGAALYWQTDNLRAASAVFFAANGSGTYWLIRRFIAPRLWSWQGVLQGLHHFADGEFAVALPDWGDNPDLAQMRQQFNLTAEHLRKQRFSSQQREIMLQTLLEQINSALILIDAQGKIVIGNPAACEIFTTLGERTEHLAGFLSAYAQIARLPKLILKPQDWRVWLNSLKHLCAQQLIGLSPARFFR